MRIQAAARLPAAAGRAARREIGHIVGAVDLAIFDADEAAEPAASGHFVHVFVDRVRPDRATPIPDSLRQALQALCDEGSKL